MSVASAASGDLDSSFGQNGVVLTNISTEGGSETVQDSVQDATGRIVVVENGILVRYLADGSVDTGFGSSGKVGLLLTARSVTVDTSDNILVAGYAFNVSGNADFALARYTSAGVLDTSFGSGGTVLTDFAGSSDNGWSVTLDASNRIIVAGYASVGGVPDFALARYTNDGVLDNSFGTAGIVITDFAGSYDYARSVVVDANGNIVAAGYARNASGNYDFALARYTSAGVLDSSFGTVGVILTDLGSNDFAESVTLDASGNLLVAGQSSVGGTSDFVVVRYTSTGVLDSGFGVGGAVSTDFAGSYDYARSVVVDANGNIVAAGYAVNASGNYDFALARYTSAGVLDSSFGTVGVILTDLGSNDFAVSVTLDANGNIVAAGYARNASGSKDFALARYTSAGVLDSSFGTGGRVLTNFAGSADVGRSMLVDINGNLVVAGNTNANGTADFVLTRHTSTGMLDSSFGTGGKVITDFAGKNDGAQAVIQDANGKLVVAGIAANASGGNDFALARYTSTGVLDNSFGAGGKVLTDFAGSHDLSYAVALDVNGNIIAAGRSLNASGNNDFALARYTSAGVLDSSFGSGGKVITDFFGGHDSVNSVALDATGNIVVAGYARNASGNDDIALARYTSAGVLDSSFGVGGKVLTDFAGSGDYSYSVIVDIAGNIVVVGRSLNASGNNDFALVRYTSAGVLDSSFGTGGKVLTDFAGSSDSAVSVIQDANGKLVVAGTARNASGTNDFALARYTSAGVLDSSFGTGGKVLTDFAGSYDNGSSVTLDANGHIVVAGSADNGIDVDIALARYLTNAAPVIGGAIASQAVNDNATISPFSAVTLSDADGDDVTVVITLDVAGNGMFTTASLTASGFSDTGAGSYTLSNGTVAAAQTAIAQLVYDPANDRVAPGSTQISTFTIDVSDGSNTTSDSFTTVVSTSINDAPSFTATPSISGTAKVGSALSVIDTGTSDPDPTDSVNLTYQWKSGGLNITNATNNSYTLTTAEAHKTITVTVTASDDFSGSTEMTTAGVSVSNTAPSNSVLPAFSSTAYVDDSLLTNTGIWSDGDGDSLVYSYQWHADGINIAGAINNNYTLTTAEAHKTITVTVTANDSNGGSVSATSNGTTLTNFAPLNTAAVVISGSAVVGNNLSTSNGTWNDRDGDTLAYTYQWKAGGLNITNATNNNYTLTTAEAHKTITVTVTANDSNGGNVNATSIGIAVANTAPSNSVLPVISGTAVVGNNLSTSNGTWSDADNDTLSYSYQWKAGGTNITNAINNNYTLTTAEAHKMITVTVTANDSNGGSVNATSSGIAVANTAPANSILPVISGSAVVGNNISTSNGTWNDADNDILSYSYQWKAGGVDITNATADNYSLTGAELAAAITVVVTASDGNGSTTSITSAATSAVDSDFDGDGIGDASDPDDDNDGVNDTVDAFPFDASESVDTDGDGIGDNADLFPNDATETLDTDNDGVGDNIDADDDNDGIPDNYELVRGLDPFNASDADLDLDGDSYSNIIEYSLGSELNDINSIPAISLLGGDSDGDGIPDVDDAFPLDATEFVDSDGDGIGNNADTDDDNDGVVDSIDGMPLDDTETADSDGDGVGDNADAFPGDATETLDTDNDGVGNNVDDDDDDDGVIDSLDAFPFDPAESVDNDGDGVGDNADAFPFDSTEWADTDNDGLGDNADIDTDGDGADDNQDAFPSDATEWLDSDLDGVGDNSDAFPFDANESIDTDEDSVGNNVDDDDDGDGVNDVEDAFPLDASETVDTDNDGVGNNADTDDDGDGVADVNDDFPLDATRSVFASIDNTNSSASGGGGSLAWLLFVIPVVMVLRRKATS